MPVTMQCAMALDVTPTKRDIVIFDLLRYLNTDIVCFPQRQLGPAEDEEVSGERKKLYGTQSERWKHPLNHFHEKYGKLEILDSDTLKAPVHEKKAIQAVKEKLEKLDDFKLTAVQQLAQGCKSLVVPLALVDRKITVLDAVTAARAEEDHQIQNWGLVEGAHDVDRENLVVQVSAASLILHLS